MEDSPYREILISDPEKVGDHTLYKVVATTKGGRSHVQQRRYMHFEWLFKELVNKYPGVVVPPIPEKKAIGRFNADFIETRRYHLERFLRKINRHPILLGSQEFISFIESSNVEDLSKKEGKGVFSFVGGVFSDVISFAKRFFLSLLQFSS